MEVQLLHLLLEYDLQGKELGSGQSFCLQHSQEKSPQRDPTECPSRTGTPPVNPAQPGSTRGPMQGQEEGKDKTTRTKSRSFPPKFNPPGLPFHFPSMQAEHLERAINAGQLCASSPAPPSFLHRSRGHRQKIPQILEKTGHGSSSLTPTLGCVCFNRWVQGRAGFAMELLPGKALWLQGFGAARSNPGSRSRPHKI